MLSRIPPYHLMIEARQRAFEKIRDTKMENTGSKKEDREIMNKEKQRLLDKWKKYLQEKSKAGARTREAILPIWEQWINRRHGNMSFRLTQLFTGHGVFYAFLNRIGKENTDICPHCTSNERDTAEHTLIECEAWIEERRELLERINISIDELTLKSLAKEMVTSKDNWSAAHRFAEKVILKKEKQERQFEAEAEPSSEEAEIGSD
ncbi:Reverse transcriptase [Camponotus japonicus]